MNDKTLIIVCASLLVILAAVSLYGADDAISYQENRKLVMFPKLNISTVLNGTFQDQFEKASSDQLPYSAKLKRSFNLIKNTCHNFSLSWFTPIIISANGTDDHAIDDTSVFRVDIVPRGNNLSELLATHHLVYPKRDINNAKKPFATRVDSYNHYAQQLTGVDFYCYYIETDVDVDFIGGHISHDFANLLADSLDSSIAFRSLKVESVNDYTQYFFRTDHHWNHSGQAKGYRDIVSLLKGDSEKLLTLNPIKVENLKYNGYKSRKLNNYTIYDDFYLNAVSLKPHTVTINGELAQYGNEQQYLAGDFDKSQGANHYAFCFGSDYGLIDYDFKRPNQANLLIIGDSFSNPINAFIASHFNHTYIVDLRHYQKDMGKPFDLADFVTQHQVDKVLFSGYYFYYLLDSFNLNPR